jgi:DNA-binding response OmpR family regulator
MNNLVENFLKWVFLILLVTITILKMPDPFKILIAEDDPVLLKMTSHYLNKKGYSITQVSNGLEAINQVENQVFDLIITDINMPYANGMEIVNLVRNILKLKTPIIVLTSEGIEETEINAFNIGASEFITKPFSLSTFGLRVEKLLS